MRHIGTSVAVDAPADRVWALLAEFDHWTDWGVSIRRVESDAQQVASGVTGRVQTTAGLWLRLPDL